MWRRISLHGDNPNVGLLASAVTLAALTGALSPILDESQITNVALLYLLATLVSSGVWGYRVGIATAVAANVLLNFFFLQPLHRLTVQQTEHLATLALFLAVAVVGSLMLSRFRFQLVRANSKEAETAILLGASREIAREPVAQHAMDKLCTVIGHAFSARGCAILTSNPLRVAGSTIDSASAATPTREESAIIREVLSSREIVRLRGQNQEFRATFVPLTGATAGVLRLLGPLHAPGGVDSDRLLSALADEASLALDRAALSREASRAEALARAEEMKSVLLSSVSHDLRSPLTAIKAAVSSLRDDSVDWREEDEGAFLETIDSQTDRLTQTVGNLLEMSRLESGVTARMESVQVAPLFEEVETATAAATTGRQIETTADPGLWVRADYGLLLQALVNLVENAAKYSWPGRPIRLEAGPVPARVRLRVHDSGPGIADDDLPHVFEKFYRGANQNAAKGSGLGLALVKAMVETCGGTVTVESSESGTTFEISLAATRSPVE